MSDSNKERHPRAFYYEQSNESRPKKVDPIHHTMKADAFREYIGCTAKNDFRINTKKFSADQAAALERAYKEQLVVRVFGAPRQDIEYIASKRERSVGGHMYHDRAGKLSNSKRQVVCWAKKVDQSEPEELWLFVFPSLQYVDQVAELVQAIVDAFNERDRKSNKTQVIVHHFERLEKQLAIWTEFTDGVARFVRHGDVIVIGNLSELLPGIESAGFSSPEPPIHFGLDKSFSMTRCVDTTARKQILLVGIAECFWGEASALYVDALIEQGARHILYGSKAGNLAAPKFIWKVMAPDGFIRLGSDEYQKITGVRNDPKLLKACSIIDSGSVVTVNTVIGEDEVERQRYVHFQPTVIDCEDGHIASLIRRHNEKVEEHFEGLEVCFVPVHFITDYIHADEESAENTKANLATDPTSAGYRETKAERFAQIGFFFGVYAHRHGLRDNIDVQLSDVRSPNKKVVIQETDNPMGGKHADYGIGGMRLELLQANWRNRPLPLKEVAALCRISQLAGYSRMFIRAYDKVQAIKDQIADSDLMLFDVLHLKFLVQRGSWISARRQIQDIEARPEHIAMLTKHAQVGAYRRRSMLVTAYYEQRSPPRDWNAGTGDDGYEFTANQVFTHIASLYDAHDVPDLEELSSELARIREKYYTDANAKGVSSDIRYEKNALSLLYLEAAAYLRWAPASENERIVKLLYIAHILNSWHGGNECSDLFGEILNSCTARGHRAVLSMAMRRDDEAAIWMRNVVEQNLNPSVAAQIGQHTLESLVQTPIERGKRIEGMINN